MVTFLYSAIHFLAALCLFPFWLYQLVFRKKYRKSTLKRLSLFLPRETTSSEECILFHAVSVGEALAIQPLVDQLFHTRKSCRIVVSTITEAAAEIVEKKIPHAEHIYFPFDFTWCCKRVLDRLNPKIIIFSEGDLWYNFLRLAHNKKIPNIVVNGKMSKRSFSRFSFFLPFSLKLFSFIDCVCAQNETMANRYGAFMPLDKITVTGNLKGDVTYAPLKEEELDELRREAFIEKTDFVITIGSTHSPEEQLLLKTLTPLLEKYTNIKIILVPRHKERFQEVFEEVKRTSFSCSLWTDLSANRTPPRIIVGDKMGQLLSWYQLASLAICAGSFTDKIGGHNILEPIYLNIPTICGPHMYSQQALFEEACLCNAIRCVDFQSLSKTAQEFYLNPKLSEEYILHGNKLKESLKGSLARTRAHVEKFLLL